MLHLWILSTIWWKQHVYQWEMEDSCFAHIRTSKFEWISLPPKYL